MVFSKINDYINPFSEGFRQAITDYKNLGLSNVQKIKTIALSAIAGLATIFLGGIGGFATFKALMENFKAEKIEKGTSPAADKADSISQNILNVSIDPTQLTTDELLDKFNPTPSKNNTITHINIELGNRFIKMSQNQQQDFLTKTLDCPDKFIYLASTFVMKSQLPIINTSEFLEQCQWPSEELKKTELPELLATAFLYKAFELQNMFLSNSGVTESGFPCTRLLINTKKIFGVGDFTNDPKPLSPVLAEAIGSVIKSIAKQRLKDLNKTHREGEHWDDMRLGIEIDIGQFRETRFPASMIAPLLPYLKDVPGIVSLALSDVGEKNINGFKDEDAEDLLNIFRSQPYLQSAHINIGGMGEEKQLAFMEEWKRIWSEPNRLQMPTVMELTHLIHFNDRNLLYSEGQ